MSLSRHGLVGVVFAILLIQGCSSSQVRNVTPSGFLGDYKKLTPGSEEQAALVWHKKGTDWRRYDKVMLDHVRIYMKSDTARHGIEPQVLAELTNYYESALVTALTQNGGYPRTSTPGVGVLRIRVAITEVSPGNAVMGTLSSITPVGLAVSGGMYATTGENTFVGEASTEVEILDALTGERLAAAIDRRAGGKAPFKGELDDAKEAFDYWANRLRVRLDQARNAP